MKKAEVLINVEDTRWSKAVPRLRSFARKTALLAWEDCPPREISLLFTDDLYMHSLNLTYRGKNKPTNVLSFPMDDDQLAGDVVLGYETIVKEAGRQGVPVAVHTAKMLIHGVLHLRGFDHMKRKDALIMEAKEDKLLEALGDPNA